MRLFHGSTVTVKRPNIQKGRKATDFGKGFYTTTNFEHIRPSPPRWRPAESAAWS